MSNKTLYIGNTAIELVSVLPIEIEDYLFEYLEPVTKIIQSVKYQFELGEVQPFHFQPITQFDYPPHLIGKGELGEVRVYFDYNMNPIALHEDIDSSNIKITLYQSLECIKLNWELLNCLALEKVLNRADCMILHSSFIVHEDEAVLFTAPSGTGKSTQANLWVKYADAKVMNGDRTLLVKENGEWKACGFPFSGSSYIYYNGIFPIKCLALIQQSPINFTQEVPLSTSFKRVYPDIVRNYWNMDFENKVMKLLEEFLLQTKHVVLGCNMEEDAVLCLKKYIEGE